MCIVAPTTMRGALKTAACALTLAYAALGHAKILSPELLVEAPRPGSATVNPAGTQALVGVEHASAHTGEVSASLYRVPLNTSAEHGAQLFAEGAASAMFLNDDTAAYLVNNTLCERPLNDVHDPNECHAVLEFPTLARNLRAVSTSSSSATLVFSALVYEDGTLEGAAAAEKSEAVKDWEKHARIFDKLMVRHWDRYLYPFRRMQLFAVDVRRNALTGHWRKASSFRNLMADTVLDSPYGPLGDGKDFAVSEDWVAFTAKDPDTPEAWHTKANIYLVPLKGGEKPRQVSATGRGWAGVPALSSDGDTLAFLQQYKDGFESDRKVLQLYSIASGRQVEPFADWQLSPDSLTFSPDAKSLYITVVEDEQTKLYQTDLEKHGKTTTVGNRRVLVADGKVSAPRELADGSVVYTRSTIDHPNDVYRLKKGKTQRLTNFFRASPAHQDVELGAKAKQFSYAGSDNVTMHGWILTPPKYKETISQGDKLPLAVLIHGGPEGDWNNAWSTRWNPRVFAAAGFVVITLDPSGSTGYGQKMTDRILQHWGDRPLEDIRKGVHYILDTEPHIDRERVVAAGASFGGYMVNWIQGHNDDKLFKGLVTHDGMFSTVSTYYSTEELYFPESEFGGVPWEVEENFTKFSPHRYTQHWNTPHLIVHGGKDYRLDPAEGISAFTALQRRGVPSRFVFFPDEGHWVNNPKNSLIWHNEVLNWLTNWALPGAPHAAAAPASTADHALVFQ